MPINLVDHPADPQCEGHQWSVADLDALAGLTAIVMIGRARQIGSILDGAEQGSVTILPTLKARLKNELVLEDGASPSHRDGLLFETMCWIVARIEAGADEVLSDPHRRATQQGADTVKVIFDPVQRELVGVTVFEQKCSSRPRRRFLQEVLPAFRTWLDGTRDDELTQVAIGLLARYNLTDEESNRAFGQLVLNRPLAFRAALTVTPENYAVADCVALFSGYDGLAVAMTSRFGDTFPLPDVRAWFALFAAAVWAKIEVF